MVRSFSRRSRSLLHSVADGRHILVQDQPDPDSLAVPLDSSQFDDLASSQAPPPSSQQSYTVDLAEDLMRSKQEIQRRREDLKLTIAGVKVRFPFPSLPHLLASLTLSTQVNNAKVFIGELNPRGPKHLEGFAAATADLSRRITLLENNFRYVSSLFCPPLPLANMSPSHRGPNNDLAPWEPTAPEHRIEVVIRSSKPGATAADHAAMEQIFLTWLATVMSGVSSNADIITLPDDMGAWFPFLFTDFLLSPLPPHERSVLTCSPFSEVTFEALAGQGRLLANRRIFENKLFSSFGPGVYVTIYSNGALSLSLSLSPFRY